MIRRWMVALFLPVLASCGRDDSGSGPDILKVPYALAASPNLDPGVTDRHFLYVAERDLGNIRIANVPGFSIVSETFQVGGVLDQIAVSGDGDRLFATREDADEVAVFSAFASVSGTACAVQAIPVVGPAATETWTVTFTNGAGSFAVQGSVSGSQAGGVHTGAQDTLYHTDRFQLRLTIPMACSFSSGSQFTVDVTATPLDSPHDFTLSGLANPAFLGAVAGDVHLLLGNATDRAVYAVDMIPFSSATPPSSVIPVQVLAPAASSPRRIRTREDRAEAYVAYEGEARLARVSLPGLATASLTLDTTYTSVPGGRAAAVDSGGGWIFMAGRGDDAVYLVDAATGLIHVIYDIPGTAEDVTVVDNGGLRTGYAADSAGLLHRLLEPGIASGNPSLSVTDVAIQAGITPNGTWTADFTAATLPGFQVTAPGGIVQAAAGALNSVYQTDAKDLSFVIRGGPASAGDQVTITVADDLVPMPAGTLSSAVIRLLRIGLPPLIPVANAGAGTLSVFEGLNTSPIMTVH